MKKTTLFLVLTSFFTYNAYSEEGEANPDIAYVDMAAVEQPAKPAFREIIELTKENYEAQLLSSHLLVIDVSAEWCGPCKRFKPIFQEASREFSATWQFAEIDGDRAEDLTSSLSVSAYPTLIFMRDGKEIERTQGFMSKEEFTAILTKLS